MAVLAQVLKVLLDVYSIVIIARAFLSFFAYDSYSPLMQFLMTVTEPVLAPIRRLMPAGGAFDFSPIIALILIQAVEALVLSALLGGAR